MGATFYSVCCLTGTVQVRYTWYLIITVGHNVVRLEKIEAWLGHLLLVNGGTGI